MNDILKYLELLWLSEKESKVYLSLYKMWNSVAWMIVKDTGIARATVYQILEKLIEKWLVFKIDKWNILNYMAEEPEKILNNIIEEENIKRQKKIFNSLLPQLVKFKNPWNYIPKVSYFEGIDSYINLLDEIFESNEKEILMITSSEIKSKHVWDEVKHQKIHEYEMWEFLRERVKRKIKMKMITTKNDFSDNLLQSDSLELRETKILPNDFWDIESLIIYWDKVLLLTDNSPVIWIYIEDNQLKNMFINIFNFIWKSI